MFFLSFFLFTFCINYLFRIFKGEIKEIYIFFVPNLLLSTSIIFLSFYIEKKTIIIYIIISFLIISMSILVPLFYYILNYGALQIYSDLKEMFLEEQYSDHIGILYAFLLLIYDIFLFRVYLKLRLNYKTL